MFKKITQNADLLLRPKKKKKKIICEKELKISFSASGALSAFVYILLTKAFTLSVTKLFKRCKHVNKCVFACCFCVKRTLWRTSCVCVCKRERVSVWANVCPCFQAHARAFVHLGSP